MPRPTLLALLAVVVAALAACERERVEVAESDDGAAVSPSMPETDAEPPIFPVGDGSADVLATCGSSTAIGRCAPCPTGYLTLPDGSTSCDCCP